MSVEMTSMSATAFCYFVYITTRCWIPVLASPHEKHATEPNFQLNVAMKNFELRYESKLQALKSEMSASNEMLKQELMLMKNKVEQERQENGNALQKLQMELKSTKKDVRDLQLQVNSDCHEEIMEIKRVKAELNKTRTHFEQKLYSFKQKLFSEDKVMATEIISSKGKTHGTNRSGGQTGNIYKGNNETRENTSPVPHQNKQYHESPKRQINRSRVAFFARTSSHSPKLQPNQDIVFDDVVTNIGGAYNNHHGTFVAPTSGVYVFHTSVLTVGHALTAKVVKNGQTLARLLDSRDRDHAGQTVIVVLNKGEDIYIQVEYDNDSIVHGYMYSTFSGFLLYENEDPQLIGK